ncbi:MAG: AAA family ATPase [Desulfobacteraceae bacterium]|nr:AAA family ATPase [Desulfobacteraceae bacterium]MDH3722316.1 AAA family ATPase [Desulfobacteraceae bacterium]MDH3838034.1 AAA family ATPase [Desulfobacteraceae bacterium]MDH3873039.1 AAA family ATPase [Desulfobacteraceae bacterium]MDH3880701.1 AAA family ATPase [Desulfobacteraceae bacterium]
MMRIISIANQKGGCGKTTSAINLSACLAHKRRKVLLIDMDPQGHSAIGLNIHTGELKKTVCDVLYDSNDAKTVLNDVTIEVGNNFDIAPSNISLSALEQHLSKVQGRESKLKEAIDGLYQIYDYIIIDCPPSLGLLTFNSLIASTEVIVPIEMSLFSLHGISKLLKIIDLVREKTGHEVRIKVIATMYDKRTRISKEVLQDIQKHFQDSMFITVINTNVTLKEAVSFGKSIVDYDQKANGFRDYMALAKEVIAEEKILGARPVKQKKPFPPATMVEKQFIYDAPGASCVKIAGTFNNWNTSEESLMERKKDGTWSKSVYLAPGTYQYRFLIDDEWVADQNNSNQVKNPFGDKNSVIKI